LWPDFIPVGQDRQEMGWSENKVRLSGHPWGLLIPANWHKIAPPSFGEKETVCTVWSGTIHWFWLARFYFCRAVFPAPMEG
jgi:hypothetical protein